MTGLGASSFEALVFVGAFLVLMSIIASRASAQFGVPALLLFLLIGMLAGSEGPGGIHFDDPQLAQSVGVVALALILFAGGMDTEWRSVRPVLVPALGLSTLGVLLTAGLLGFFASLITDLTILEGLLLGSIVASTDAAAVFAVLRSRGVNLKGNLRPLLELESGSNDPMAVFLTIGFIGLLGNSESSVASLVPMFFTQMIFGALLGYVAGRAMILVANHVGLEYEGLYPVLTLAMVLLLYSGAVMLGGNGFLAVYIAGIVMGNGQFIHRRSLIRFHDGMAWLMQIAMFLVLGLLVFPSRVIPIAGTGLLVAAFLIFVARPVSVLIVLAPTRLSMRERLFVSWVGLRGAVPIILATFPLLAGAESAELMFNVVFFIVLASAALQGTSIPLVARWLGVDARPSAENAVTADVCGDSSILNNVTEMCVSPDSILSGKRIVDADLPESVQVLLVKRGGRISLTTGATLLLPGDVLLVLADDESLDGVRQLLQPRGSRNE